MVLLEQGVPSLVEHIVRFFGPLYAESQRNRLGSRQRPLGPPGHAGDGDGDAIPPRVLQGLLVAAYRALTTMARECAPVARYLAESIDVFRVQVRAPRDAAASVR